MYGKMKLMIALVLFIVFGLVFSYIATLNTLTTTINLGVWIFRDVPVFLLLIAPFAIGLLIGGFFSVAKQFFNQRIVHRQSDQLAKAKQENVTLQKQIHQLELQNAKLKTKLGEESDDESL